MSSAQPGSNLLQACAEMVEKMWKMWKSLGEWNKVSASGSSPCIFMMVGPPLLLLLHSGPDYPVLDGCRSGSEDHG